MEKNMETIIISYLETTIPHLPKASQVPVHVSSSLFCGGE